MSERPRICKHDQLGRQCNICDLEEEVAALRIQSERHFRDADRWSKDAMQVRGELTELRERNEQLTGMLARRERKRTAALMGLHEIAMHGGGSMDGAACAEHAKAIIAKLHEA